MVDDWCGYLLPVQLKYISVYLPWDIKSDKKNILFLRFSLLLQGWEVSTIKWVKNSSRNRLIVSLVAGEVGWCTLRSYFKTQELQLSWLQHRQWNSLIMARSLKAGKYKKGNKRLIRVRQQDGNLLLFIIGVMFGIIHFCCSPFLL